MFTRLLAIFIFVPMIELYVLLHVGRIIGPSATLLLIVFTGILGATLARQQGFLAWARIQRELQAGRMPAETMLDGLLIFIGGLVLLTPGLLTDMLGFALLIPPLRNAAKAKMLKYYQAKMTGGPGAFGGGTSSSSESHRYTPPRNDDYIDV